MHANLSAVLQLLPDAAPAGTNAAAVTLPAPLDPRDGDDPRYVVWCEYDGSYVVRHAKGRVVGRAVKLADVPALLAPVPAVSATEQVLFPVGARVRITGGTRNGRTAVVHRVPPRPFADHRYVVLDPTARERTVKRELVALKYLEPACP